MQIVCKISYQRLYSVHLLSINFPLKLHSTFSKMYIRHRVFAASMHVYIFVCNILRSFIAQLVISIAPTHFNSYLMRLLLYSLHTKTIIFNVFNHLKVYNILAIVEGQKHSKHMKTTIFAILLFIQQFQ